MFARAVSRAGAVRFITVQAVAFLVLSGRTMRCQATTSAAEAVSGAWVTVGAGVAHARSKTGREALSASAVVELERGDRVFSARLNSTGVLVGGAEMHALGFFAGYGSAPGRWTFGAASIGLTAVERKACLSGCGVFESGPRKLGPTRAGPGLAFAADGTLRLGKSGGVGLGASAFVNVNTLQSFAGVELNVSIGKWR